MGEDGLSHERILDAAESVLRRFGPGKATVVDVARALDVSHASVYRYFPSKAALRDAVVERFLESMAPALQSIVDEDAPAPDRLRRWVATLSAWKQDRARSEPELFAAYMALAGDARDVVARHIDHLVAQASAIIADGLRRGEFAPTDPQRAARSVLLATSRFHHPAHAGEWGDPDTSESFDSVWSLVARGLGAADA